MRQGEREERSRGAETRRKKKRSEKISLASLKARRKKEAVDEWRKERVSGCKGSRAFRVPKEGEVPRIPAELRGAPKRIGSRFSQLASGHAMIAPFIKEKFGWIDSDLCWWCGTARQTREHLFKGCTT